MVGASKMKECEAWRAEISTETEDASVGLMSKTSPNRRQTTQWKFKLMVFAVGCFWITAGFGLLYYCSNSNYQVHGDASPTYYTSPFAPSGPTAFLNMKAASKTATAQYHHTTTTKSYTSSHRPITERLAQSVKNLLQGTWLWG